MNNADQGTAYKIGLYYVFNLNILGTLTKRSRKIISHTPMRRLGSPEDLLGALLWLADENMSGFVTGIIIPVDGGFMAYSGV